MKSWHTISTAALLCTIFTSPACKPAANDSVPSYRSTSANATVRFDAARLIGTWDCGKVGIFRNLLTYQKPNIFIQQVIRYSETDQNAQAQILKYYFTYKIGQPNAQGKGATNIDYTRVKITDTRMLAAEVTAANVDRNSGKAQCQAINYKLNEEADVTDCFKFDKVGPYMFSVVKVSGAQIRLGNCFPNDPNCGTVDQRGEFLWDPCDKMQP